MSSGQRILALSDIFWSPRNQGITVDDLTTLVEQTTPDLILLAGDLVNDHPYRQTELQFYWQQVGRFLALLEAYQLPCCIVRGNWDEVPYYAQMMNQPYNHVVDISEKQVEVNGLHLLGVSNTFTTKKRLMDQLRSTHLDPLDIVLTHAETRRRVYFFELPTKLIITGHFDEKLCQVRDKLFLAFSGYPGQYAVIQYQPNDIEVNYSVGPTSYSVHLINQQAAWNPDPPQDWLRYGQRIEALLNLRERLPELTSDNLRAEITQLQALGINKTQIMEYIPGASKFLK